MNDDPELLRRLADGDDQALEALLIQHMPALHGFVRLRAGRQVRSREETIDLVQSVCREILVHRERFEHPTENGFKRWLYATALRKIGHRAEHWRAAKRDAARDLPDPDDKALLGAYASVCTPSRAAVAREEVARIEAAFDQLPDHYREVLVLRRIAGLDYADIAAELGKTEVNVRTILSRAMARLAEVLGEG
ncbi:RNA polymerase sigma factor [Engelhardtia mirabilis]|uniref:ECF RNA polymerase sigma factor SigD n=1 Tax=Engelhardtia mirabilis TaxID=2528011 RepID=A0A518BSM2_9BACT|nr:ECF RNA polymerase sigma factor SigD [Planctomycetes bacterium Pla133]QDV04297.1 ECF RNA polymerase sigma factor SigD [Planctomycetes bacterium Pla86]